MRISRRTIAAVVAMTGVAAVLASATGASASAARVNALTPASARYSVPGELDGVAAASDSSAWAVGYTGENAGPKILMVHWNGKSWSRVTKPGVLDGATGQLTAVKVVSAKDAWAVGYTGDPGGTTRSLLLHWNGKAWSQVATPAPVKNGVLNAVTATASGGWAVGYYISGGEAAIDYKPLIFRLSGTKWTTVNSKLGAGVGLTGVAATGKTTWATGDEIGMITGALAEWNGSKWSWDNSFPVAGPYHSLADIAANSKGLAFAVGSNGNLPETPALSMEWTGKAWKKVTVDAPVGSSLNSVTFAPGGTAWASGAVGEQGLIMRWNGKAWVSVLKPDSSVEALSFSTASYGWSVGAADISSSVNETVILHWNGHAWS